MKFCEAMDLLKSGHKVTRQPWSDGVYFLMDGQDVKSYQPMLRHYAYNEDIMVSTGWLIDEDPKEYSFSEIIPMLQSGSKAKLSDWKDSYIYLDKDERVLVISSMDIYPFTPQFSDFLAEDWIEIL